MMRLEIPPATLARMTYQKFARRRTRMLVLESNYWLDGACIRAAERLGWEVAHAPVVMKGVLSREQIAGLLETVLHFQPDFMLNINLSGMDEGGLFAGLFADLGMPLATWFVDDPRTIMMDRDCYATPLSAAFTWEPAYAGYLQAHGFPVVETLPLGVDDTIFNMLFKEGALGPPSFVAHSLLEWKRAEWAWLAQRPELAMAVHEALEEGRVTRERFAMGLEAMIGEGECEGLDPHERRHAELYCFLEGTRRLRTEYVQALTDEGLIVHGDEGWEELVSLHGPRIEYDNALVAHYRESAVNFNLTSLQMASAFNQRVMDVPTAGGFLLTDAQAEIARIFEADEVAVYHEIGEARELLRFYMRNEPARRTIVEKARARILGEHTYRHRLEQMREALAGAFGG